MVSSQAEPGIINVGHSIERRNFRRFSLLLPVLFRWTNGSEHYDVGEGANVGLGGIFIFSTKCPSVGTQVEVEFSVPAFDRMTREVRLRCLGQVSRLEACGQVSGFAVTGRIEGEHKEEQLENMAVTVLTKQ